MDISQVSALFQSVQVAAQLLGSAVEARDDAKLAKAQAEMHKAIADANGAVLAMQAKLFSQLEKLTAMHEQLALANQKIVELNNARLETERYELFQFPSGAQAMRIKPESQGREPLHYLCQPCFDQGSRMVLQPNEGAFGEYFICTKCQYKHWVRKISSAPMQRRVADTDWP